MTTFVHRWIAITAIVSIACAIDGGWTLRWLALSPDAVLHGELWRLVTWGLIVRAPFTLVIVSWLIYRFGSDLATQWGEARLRGVAVQLGIVAAFATCGLAIVIGTSEPQTCSSLTMLPLVILWGRMNPTRELVVYGMFPIKAPQFVLYALALVVLVEIYYGVYAFAPELVACVLAAIYPKGWLRGP